jgi:hypothetical protein
VNPAAILVLQYFVYPAAVVITGWAVTSRKKDKTTVEQIRAETKKAEVEGVVSEKTVHAAVQLADVETLLAQITAMGRAVEGERLARTEERESLSRQLSAAEERARLRDEKLDQALEVIEDLRVDQQRCHREMLDMYRRDQHYSQALTNIGNWFAGNMPLMRMAVPDLEEPPEVQMLSPMLPPPDEMPGLPRRRWYDNMEPEEEHDVEDG